MANVVMRPTTILERRLIAPPREEAAVARERGDGELAAALVHAQRFTADPAPRHRGDIYVVTFLKRHPFAARRRHDLVRGREDQMVAPVASIWLHRDECR